jgi:hydroxymethylglutaryl-CoA reductase
MSKQVSGFSKLSKEAKIEWLANEYLNGDTEAIELLKKLLERQP